MTHTVHRQAHPYRPWIIALSCVAVGFGAIVAIKPPKSKSTTEEQFVEASESPGSGPEGMVWTPGGPLWMGSAQDHENNAPLHQVAVSGFWMDKTEVTNAQFEAFVKVTGYVTTAERPPTEEELKQGEVPLEKRVPFSV